MDRQTTLYEIKVRLERMDTETLKGLLRLLDYRELKLSASGLPYTGDPETDEILDDPELTERLLAYQRRFAGLSPEERAAKLAEMRAQGELIPWEQVKAELGL